MHACSTAGKSYQCPMPDVALLLMRLMLGAVFLYHGVPKLMHIQDTVEFITKLGIPSPTLSAWLSAIAEGVGGGLLVLGLLTRLTTAPMAFNMAVAIIAVHSAHFGLDQGGMEYALTLGVMLIALGLLGPGRISMDHLIFGRRAAGKDSAAGASGGG